MGAITAGVDDAFGNTFVVEMEDLLAQNMVFQCHRAARAADLQGILIVRNRRALRCGQDRAAIRLVGFAARALLDVLSIEIGLGQHLVVDVFGHRKILFNPRVSPGE